MGAVIDGNNGNFPGQVVVSGRPTSSSHVLRSVDVGNRVAFIQDLDLNAAAPLDLTTLAIPNGTKFIPLRAFVVNATANLSVAQLGLYTASGAGGTAVVSPAALTNLTAAGKFHELTIAALTDPISVTTLYPRLTVASGVAGTADLILEYLDISTL